MMDEIEIVASIEQSIGNDTVGEMWTETCIFKITDPIQKVYEWAAGIERTQIEKVRANVKLSIGKRFYPKVQEPDRKEKK